MTGIDRAAFDVEDFVIAWLTPLGVTDRRRRAGQALPFRLVRRVTGRDDVEAFNDAAVVSIHTLADASDMPAAVAAADATHRRMLLLASQPDADADAVGDRAADIEYVEVVESPRWEDYGNDQIVRKVGRYRICLGYARVAVP